MDDNCSHPCHQFSTAFNSMDFTYCLWVSSVLFWIFTMMIEANALTHDMPLPKRNKNNLNQPKLKKSSERSSSPKSKKSSSSSSSSSLSSSSSSSLSSKRSKSSQRKCCENGGICVMGVFCHCPKNFFGFRCEHEMKPCGPIEHKSWARVGCHLCRCYDSELLCLSRVYGGCDDKPVKEDIEVSDYLDNIHIFPPEKTTIDPLYADYYDDRNSYNHYDDDDNASSSPPPSSSSSSSSSSNLYISLTSHFIKVILMISVYLALYYDNPFRQNERIS